MSGSRLAPLQPQERISEIDIIRGIALLGILMVNMALFKYPLYLVDRNPMEFTAGLDQTVAWLIQLLFAGKFYAIFSFLFGLGFYIFMERAGVKELPVGAVYRRRITILLALGLFHILFLWSGDILFTYALAGFILMAFKNVKLAALKNWIIAIFVVSTFMIGGIILLEELTVLVMGAEYQKMMAEMIDRAFFYYGQGSYLELTLFRLTNEVPILLINAIISLPMIMGFFLCGLYAGKAGVFKDIEGSMPLIKKHCKWGLLGGLLFSLLYFLAAAGLIPLNTWLVSPALFSLNFISSIFLFQFYVAGIIIILRSPFVKKLLRPLAAAGRMALTNYLSQTLICILIFNGYGLGYYGQVSLSQGALLTVSIFLLQVIWSNIWLGIYQYGPLEWLWRKYTYSAASEGAVRIPL